MSDSMRRRAESIRSKLSDPHSSGDLQQILRAAENLAAEVLAEHPADDDEPVTEEWLESVGLGDEIAMGGGFSLLLCAGFGGEILFQQSAAFGWDDCRSGYPLEHIETRGDVRRLCAALGVELKEPSNVE